MTIQTLDFNSDVIKGPNTTGTYAGLNDVDFETGIGLGVGGYYAGGLTSYSLASNERCIAVRLLTIAQSIFSGPIVATAWLNTPWPSPATAVLVWLSYVQPFAVLAPSPWVANSPNGDEWTQNRIDALEISWATQEGTAMFINGAGVELDIRVKPIVTSVTAPTGAQSQRRPTVVWTTTIGDSQAQKAFRVKAFSEAQYTSLGFNPDVTPAAYDSGDHTGVGTNHTPTGDLPDGNVRIYVKVSKDFNATNWWSDWVYSSVSLTPVVPAATTLWPPDGATVTTNRPQLGGTALPITFLPARVRLQWQLAPDAGFSGTPLTIIEEDTAFRTAGAGYFDMDPAVGVPYPDHLYQGVWYIRVRELDEYGTAGAWSAATSFTVLHLPVAAGLNPAGGQWIAYGTGTVSLAWQFTDPWRDDYQTGYEIVVENNDDATEVVDTGVVISDQVMTVVDIPPELKDEELRWRIQVYDSESVAGNYSDNAVFVVADGPSVTFVAPADGSVVVQPRPPFDWEVFLSAGRVQQQYRLVVLNIFDLPVWDTGWTTTPNTFATPTVPILANNAVYVATVYVRDNRGLQGSATSTFTTEWIAPDAASDVTIDTTRLDIQGFVAIQWTSISDDAEFAMWRVYRRDSVVTDWTLVAEIDEQNLYYAVIDWHARSNVEVHYAVVQIANRFGVQVDSDFESHIIYPPGTHYWLIDDDDYGAATAELLDFDNVVVVNSQKLEHVTGDDFSDEQESEEILLIGRGRKIEYGTNWGIRGTLTADLRNVDGGKSAQQQRLDMQALQASQHDLFLRNPFGDLWLVAPTNIQVSRISGVGTHAYATLTIPYTEVRG